MGLGLGLGLGWVWVWVWGWGRTNLAVDRPRAGHGPARREHDASVGVGESRAVRQLDDDVHVAAVEEVRGADELAAPAISCLHALGYARSRGRRASRDLVRVRVRVWAWVRVRVRARVRARARARTRVRGRAVASPVASPVAPLVGVDGRAAQARSSSQRPLPLELPG